MKKYVSGRGSVPDPAGGAYSAPPDLVAGSGGGEGNKERGELRKEGKGNRREGKGR